MSMQTRDLHCVDCGEFVMNVACEYATYPPCGNCGGEMVIDWRAGQAPSTDVYGSPIYSDATGMYHTSQRDKVRHMREWGYDEAGDKVGGARRDHTLKRTGFSFQGQSTRKTVSEG
jgi:hypothetical protein